MAAFNKAKFNLAGFNIYELIGVPVELSGSISAQSGVSGSLTKGVPLSGQILVQSTASGHIEKTLPLAGEINTETTINGTMQKQSLLFGQTESQSSVFGTLSKEISFVGGISVISDLWGALSVPQRIELSGQMLSQSNISGTLDKKESLAGNVAAVSHASGNLSKWISILSSIFNQSNIYGQVAKQVVLQGQMRTESATTGQVEVYKALAGQLRGQPRVDGVLVLARWLSGIVIAQSDIGGVLSALSPDSFIVLTGEFNPLVVLGETEFNLLVPLGGRFDVWVEMGVVNEMTVENQNFSMYAGETRFLKFPISGETNLATVKWALANTPQLNVVVAKDNSSIDVTVDDAAVTVTLRPEDTVNLSGVYRHELVGIDANGEVAWMTVGDVRIKPTAIKV